MKLEQAARQALEALEEMFHSNSTKVAVEKYNTAHNALREALAEQAEQEPVGEMIDKAGYKGAAWYLEPPTTGTQLYASPVRTKDLTDHEIDAIDDANWENENKTWNIKKFARAVIAADREKNNANNNT